MGAGEGGEVWEQRREVRCGSRGGRWCGIILQMTFMLWSLHSQSMAQAEVLAKQSTDMKRAKAREMRALWANEHAANLARVQSEEEEKVASTLEELEAKDRKTRQLLCSRENAIRQVRHVTT